MRIRDKYDDTQGRIVPVWDFWGTARWYTEDDAYQGLINDEGAHTIVLTINALDGTVIDRELGY